MMMDDMTTDDMLMEKALFDFYLVSKPNLMTAMDILINRVSLV